MKKLLLLLLLASTAQAQTITYINKNTDRFECVDIYDATTAKRLTAAVTSPDCEYAQTLNGSANESAYADLTTAESVVGTVGQLCFKILAAEDNIDGTVKVSCKVGNANAADYVGRFSTLRPRMSINTGDVTYDAVAARGTLQSATATTAVIAAAESSADNRLAGNKIIILSGTDANDWQCIASNVNSTDTIAVTGPGWRTIPDNTSTYDITADAGCLANIAQWNKTVVTGTGPISSIFYRN